MDRKRQSKDSKPPSERGSAEGSEAAAPLHRRIGYSASGLLKESLELASPRAVTGILASIDTNNTKPGPSSSSNGVNEASLAFSSSPPGSESTLGRGEAFRSNEKSGTSVIRHGQVAFDEFLERPNELEHQPDGLQERSEFIGDNPGAFTPKPAEDDLRQVYERETWKRQNATQDSKYGKSDGAAVVALLSDSACMTDEEPGSTLDSESNGAEGHSLGRLQTGKRVAESGDLSLAPTLLGLIPDFGAPWDLCHASSAGPNRIYERRRLLESGLGDVQPWVDILDRYHDEVWGEMLPLVQEAREEWTAAGKSQTCLRDGPATRRLKVVLNHLANSKNG